MESGDEAMTYSEILDDNPGNFLIQNNYELQDCLSVEPIFTEIETGTWASESFPILLNDINAREVTDNKIERIESRSNSHIQVSQLETGDAAVDNDSGALQLSCENQQGTQLLLFTNGNTYEISYSNDKSVELQDLNEDADLLDNTTEIIQIVTPSTSLGQNEDQEANNFNSDSPDPESEELPDLNEFHTVVTARKCKVCSFLCESSVEITEHLKEAHEDLIKIKQASEKVENNNGQKLKMRSLLDTNILTEKNLTVFLCSICNSTSPTKELLMDHLKTHVEENKLANSEVIEIGTSSNGTSQNSMRKISTALLRKQQKAMNKIKCPVEGCNLKFSTNESRLRHQECHVSDQVIFQCPECRQKFSQWRMCCKHLWIQHKIDAGLYNCTICNNYKSNSAVLVINHMDIHNSEKPFICSECGKGFKQMNQLRNHTVIHNRKELTSSPSTKCKICDRFFANKKSLQKHIESVHKKSKPYVCNLCGHRTSRKSMLEVHYRQHTGEKPFHCSHCTYRTSDHNCLRRHVMKHFHVMQYSCPYCDYQAIQSSAYKNHLMTRHPDAEEIFKCGYCSFTSLKFDSYLTHVKCHEYEEKERTKENSPMSLTISADGSEDNESQVYLNLPDNDYHSDDIGEGEDIA